MINQMRNKIMEQIVYFEENMTDFLDLYFPYSGTENYRRKRFEALLTQYMKTLEQMVQQSDVEFAIDSVAIGCKVGLFDLDQNITEHYTITFPDDANPDDNQISFLSPLGQQLLLAKLGQELTIETPGDRIHATISEIKMVL